MEPMSTDTIFDMASLTKVMATTPAIMLLVENGQIRLGDRVHRYLPEFAGGGKESITVRQLLTHYSGLRPDFDLSEPWEGYAAAMEQLWKEQTRSEPGKEFVYSDLNFIALGEIVRRVSGQSLDAFVETHLYGTLGMSETTFNPPSEWRKRIAPTESRARSLEYLKGMISSPLSGRLSSMWRIHFRKRSCAVRSMIPPHGAWEGLRVTRDSSRVPTTSPFMRRCFSTRGHVRAGESFLL